MNSQCCPIASACRSLDMCRDATEAELLAIEEGLKLALQWTNLQIRVETDCAEAIGFVTSNSNTSGYAFRITVIRELLGERNSKLVKIGRESNAVAHELAKLGRVQKRTDFWLSGFPQEVLDLVAKDCNSISN